MLSLPRRARPRRTASLATLGAASFGLTAALAVLLLADVRSASAQACGDGTIDAGETCDDGNLIDGDCCSSTCQIEPSSVVCRPSAGACDVAESCDGVNPTCPADVVVGAGTECRASVGSCDVAEACDGSSPACPADVVVGAGTTCRAATGACDVAESCDGVSGACPADGFVANSTPCDDGNACTVGETCQAGICTAGTAGNSGQVCRPAAGPCDVAETCNGTSTCPPDQLRPSSFVCRGSQGQCDLVETCTGTSAACPADLKSTGLCRPAASTCDVAEVCDGVSNFCPPNLFAPNGTLCTDDGQTCTADLCSNGVCTHAPGNAGLVCRAATGVCDVAEVCNGTSSTCPTDVKVADGTTCSDGQSCTVNDQCHSGTCVGTTTGCGDGVVACGEQCDDGNTVSGDGCSATCQTETGGGEVCNDLIDNEPDGKFDCDDSDCTCPPLVNGGVPARTSRLIIKRSLDLIKLQGAVHPATSFDPPSEKFGLLITNANGRVFSAVISPGQILKVGDGQWVYRNRLAKLSGGIFTLKLRQATTGSGSVLRFSLVAMGELTGATLPAMTTEIVVGDDVAANKMSWAQLKTGFKGTLP